MSKSSAIQVPTQADIDAYERDGAVCLRGVFDTSWLESPVAAQMFCNLTGSARSINFLRRLETPVGARTSDTWDWGAFQDWTRTLG